MFANAAPPELKLSQGPLMVCAEEKTLLEPEAAVSASRVAAGGAYLYVPGFTTERWGGSLRKFRIDVNEEDGEIRVAQQPEWEAGALLTEASAAPGGVAARSIYTSKRYSDGSIQTVPFYEAYLSEAQKASLRQAAETGASNLHELRVNYLRGDRNHEQGKAGGLFRARDTLLGNIVNSRAVYVGVPKSLMGGKSYEQFLDAHRSRRHAVYVGANDGMLHAFDAEDGRELFAYLPNAVMARAKNLTAPAYSHEPFVDGGISITEANIQGRWSTVLVSALGAGSQGVFALDVTDPDRFAAGLGALWEFTDEDDADIGHILGKPLVAKFRYAMKDGKSQFRYFAVVSSGYNNYRQDGKDRFNAAGDNFVFLLSLDKSPADRWTLGQNYFKFRLPVTDASLPSGAAMPAVVSGSEGEVRYLYVADLQGHVWRLTFDGTAPWKSATAPKILFRASDDYGKPQPITAPLRVVFAPGGYLILFGTGQLLEEVDVMPANFALQSFYAVHDRIDKQAVLNRSTLDRRTARLEGDTVALTGKPYDLSNASQHGWFFDFPGSGKSGERMISAAVALDGKIYFHTVSPGADACDRRGGRSYVIDILRGLPPAGKQTGTVLPLNLSAHPVVMDVGKHRIAGPNPFAQRMVKKRIAVLAAGSGGVQVMSQTGAAASFEYVVPAGRFSWKELSNWTDLRLPSKDGK
jgi:type IV pilus assembly protein PilY1